MKKTGAILAAIVVVAGVLYVLLTARMGRVTAADFLPEEVLVTMEQRDLGSLLDDFKGSRLGREVTGVNYAKIAADLGVEQQTVDRINGTRQQLGDFLSSPFFQELFGKEFTFAILPVADIETSSPDKIAAASFLLISKPSHGADILKLISSFFTRQLDQASSQHGKYTLTRYVLAQDLNLSVAAVEGYVIAALDEGLVRDGLDRVTAKLAGKTEGGRKTLAQNSEYMRLRQELEGAKFFACVSMPVLYAQAVRLSEILDQPEKEEMQQAITQWQGWGTLAFGAWKESGQIRDKGVVLLHKEKMEPLVAKMCGVKPVENKTLSMVPADVAAYYWTNTLNMNMFWEMFVQEMQGSEEQLKAMEEDVRKAAGMDLARILTIFGPEAAFLLQDVVTDGFIPFPNATVFLKIEKEQDLEKLFQSLFDGMSIPVQTQDYKGVSLNHLDVSFHPSLQPVYALHKGYLILACSVDMVKKIVDLQSNEGKNDGSGARLVADKSFQQMNNGLHKALTGNNNSVSFIKFASLLQISRKLLNWGGSILSMQDPETARKSKVVIDELIFPLLDGLGMYEGSGSRSVIQDDAIILESITVPAQ